MRYRRLTPTLEPDTQPIPSPVAPMPAKPQLPSSAPMSALTLAALATRATAIQDEMVALRCFFAAEMGSDAEKAALIALRSAMDAIDAATHMLGFTPRPMPAPHRMWQPRKEPE